MNDNVLTRQMYCERCAKKNHPTRGQTFIVCGENGFHIRVVERYVEPSKKGFTPHLVASYKMLDDETLAFSRVCCIVGCGLDVGNDPTDRNKKVFTYRKVSYEQMNVRDWNSMIENKDLGYYLD